MTSICQSEGRSFKDIYNALPSRSSVKPPKTAFVDQMAYLTKRSTQTIRMWLSGVQQPDALAKSVLEKELGIPAEVLFPKTIEK